MKQVICYFLWHYTMPHYKQIKIRVKRLYVINGLFTHNKLDNRSHSYLFLRYSSISGVIIYWKPKSTRHINWAQHDWFGEYKSNKYNQNTNRNQDYCIYNHTHPRNHKHLIPIQTMLLWFEIDWEYLCIFQLN